ncbi:hypothetical protein B0T24DRAFT_687006 [Lasiosphaeria ovina]|uniref:Uncharacterized protein n=1 Tax=Lasiosphaeria ovina TaxID=92902 RepID=A0AAE0TX61_9PEZI|nr:hypothetical protein B0T24DRAFT_687006 [Lasiosphaeria ovina]
MRLLDQVQQPCPRARRRVRRRDREDEFHYNEACPDCTVEGDIPRSRLVRCVLRPSEPPDKSRPETLGYTIGLVRFLFLMLNQDLSYKPYRCGLDHKKLPRGLVLERAACTLAEGWCTPNAEHGAHMMFERRADNDRIRLVDADSCDCWPTHVGMTHYIRHLAAWLIFPKLPKRDLKAHYDRQAEMQAAAREWQASFDRQISALIGGCSHRIPEMIPFPSEAEVEPRRQFLEKILLRWSTHYIRP